MWTTEAQDQTARESGNFSPQVVWSCDTCCIYQYLTVSNLALFYRVGHPFKDSEHQLSTIKQAGSTWSNQWYRRGLGICIYICYTWINLVDNNTVDCIRSSLRRPTSGPGLTMPQISQRIFLQEKQHKIGRNLSREKLVTDKTISLLRLRSFFQFE
jgi:hypothetical protein